MKKQLDFLVQYEEEFQGWQRRSSGKFTICYLVFLRKRRRWAFLNTLQALDPPTFKTFGLTFLRKRLWASLICSKTARYRLFLAVVRCCVTTTLAAETFSLLCVYLNYKFGLGLPSFCLFFSFFKFLLEMHPILAERISKFGVLEIIFPTIFFGKDAMVNFKTWGLCPWRL